MDLPKKQLGNTNGRNTTRGVFKAYVFFLVKDMALFDWSYSVKMHLPNKKIYMPSVGL